MNVTDAVNARRSIRAFRADPVDDETIADLLTVGIAVTVGRQRPAVAHLRRERRIDGRASASSSRIGHRGHRHTTSTRRADRAVPLVAVQDRRGHVRHSRDPPRGQAGTVRPVRQEPRLLRRTGGALLFRRPADGPAAVVGPRHVPPDVHAARSGSRPRHLPAGGLGGVRTGGQRIRRGARGAADLLWRGDRARRPGHPINSLVSDREPLEVFARFV